MMRIPRGVVIRHPLSDASGVKTTVGLYHENGAIPGDDISFYEGFGEVPRQMTGRVPDWIKKGMKRVVEVAEYADE